MRTFTTSFKSAAALVFALVVITGCASTDNGSTPTSVGAYYSTGTYDPWYHGYYDNDQDDIVTPPPGNPDSQPHPAHPIVVPPPAGPRPTPRPSIPSTPRPAPRPAGRR